VLSWSLLEAMACGVPIVASDTAPVREVIAKGSVDALVPFFDAQAVAASVVRSLEALGQAEGAHRARLQKPSQSLTAGLHAYTRLLAPAPAALTPCGSSGRRAERTPMFVAADATRC
jgi:glycosyltransferase involved in cell wall biosynthesis